VSPCLISERPPFRTVSLNITQEVSPTFQVFEETGVRVRPESIEYVASQPWPFPQSSMVGFRATADADLPLSIDADELASAKWFGRAAVQAAAAASVGATMDTAVAEKLIEQQPGLELLIPPQGVLARTLIDSWLDGK
jgi:hypothetical protein